MKRSEKFWQWACCYSWSVTFVVFVANFVMVSFVLGIVAKPMDTLSCLGVFFCGAFVIGVPLARRWCSAKWRSDPMLHGTWGTTYTSVTNGCYSYSTVWETKRNPVERSKNELVAVIILRLMLVMMTMFSIQRSHFSLGKVSHCALLLAVLVEGVVIGYWMFRIKYRNRLYEMKGV